MYSVISFFTFIFLFKSIVFENFFNNYFLNLYHPIELCLLSFFNKKFNEITFIRWIFIGWLDYEYESKIVKNIQNFDNSYIIILSWGLSLILYQFHYLIKERLILKNKIDRWIILKYNIKYSLINYTFLYLWNLNVLLDIQNVNFIYLFFNFIIFNLITFWFPGLFFNYIYGEYLYLYRNKLNFLIDKYNAKFKYFSILLLFFKSLNGIFITLFHHWNIGSEYILLINLLFYTIIIYKLNIFKNKLVKNKILYSNLISLFIIIISIIESYYSNYIIFLILQIVSIFILLLFFCINLYILNKKDKINNYPDNNIEMDIIV